MITGEKIVALLCLPDLIKEGTISIMKQVSGNFKIKEFSDLNYFNECFKRDNYQVIITDATILLSGYKVLNNIKKANEGIVLIAIQYQLINQTLLNICDTVIPIDQQENESIRVIEQALSNYSLDRDSRSDILSDRESEVLKLLVTGFSGKEIADRLNISINTVITHRKNISQKTGIKSLAGLTIYAVTNKIISMKNL